MALLEMQDLKTFFTTKRGVVKAVNGVSYKVEAGKTLGVVGEIRSRQERFRDGACSSCWTATAISPGAASCLTAGI